MSEVRDLTHWTDWTDGELIDQAAGACQDRALLECDYVREAIALNVIAPFRQKLTTLRAENETLKKAQRAVVTLETLQGQELKHLREKHRGEWAATQTLDSERDANAILTEENESLRAENEMRTAELDFAVEKMTAYRAENELLREVVKVADDAINEMFRYFDGGETRGSYDGKPERAQLRKAGYAARNALAQVAK